MSNALTENTNVDENIVNWTLKTYLMSRKTLFEKMS